MARPASLTIFHALLRSADIPIPVAEFKFHERRKWRLDYAWPDSLVALEVEGGIFGYVDQKTGQRRRGGAHGSIYGIKRDMEKYNAAALAGWCVLRCLPTTLNSTDTIMMLRAALASRSPGSAHGAAGSADSANMPHAHVD